MRQVSDIHQQVALEFTEQYIKQLTRGELLLRHLMNEEKEGDALPA